MSKVTEFIMAGQVRIIHPLNAINIFMTHHGKSSTNSQAK
jgi:hypothetical protein